MLEKPTPEQQAILEHDPKTHGRVLAGPGTGKSTTAVALIERLMEQADPPRVKLLTFTRAATAELSKKLSDSAAGPSVRASTIHSFALSVLVRNPGCASFPHPLRIPDHYEYKALVRPHLAQQTRVDVRQLDKLVAEMAARWESLAPDDRPDISPEDRARFLGAWVQHRRVFGYTLLAELPDLCRCALRDHDDLSGTDYALMAVDEYQDLNACDLEVLRRLAERGTHILAVGDDDQSIYSFRKAHPAGIRRFLREFQTDRDYKLTQCHRSPRLIMEWAQHVIRGDLQRETRVPLTFGSDAPEGTAALLRFKSGESEATGVADLVKWLKEVKNVPYSEILVLSRTDYNGTFTKLAKTEFKKRGVPVTDPDELLCLLAEPDNRRLLCALHLLVNPTDSLAWWTLVHLCKGLGASFVEHLYNESCSSNRTFGEAFQAAAGSGFEGVAAATRQRATSLWEEASAWLDTTSLHVEQAQADWGALILSDVDCGRLPPCSEGFRLLLLSLDGVMEEPQEMERFLSQVEPLGKDLMLSHSEGVRFMTMIGSKGLTVMATILMGVDNDLIPRPGENLDEERRLLYVAMTRSKEHLFLTWARTRRGPAARSGRQNIGRRQPSDLLRGGSEESKDGPSYIQAL